MAKPTKAGIAPDLDLADGYIIEYTALDATTGADVPTVIVSLATMTVEQVEGDDLSNLLEPIDPTWVAIANDFNPSQ